jgi:hypothetical protein
MILNPNMLVEPVILKGAYVRLDPLTCDHHTALCKVGLDPELLRWTESYEPTPDGLRQYIETALTEQEQKRALPFAAPIKNISI